MGRVGECVAGGDCFGVDRLGDGEVLGEEGGSERNFDKMMHTRSAVGCFSESEARKVGAAWYAAHRRSENPVHPPRLPNTCALTVDRIE